MKLLPQTVRRYAILWMLLPLSLLAIMTMSFRNQQNPAIVKGAYVSSLPDGASMMLLFSDGYFTLTTYSIPEKKFMYTWGGPFAIAGETIKVQVEFDTWQKGTVGQEVGSNFSVVKDGVMFNNTLFKTVDDGTEALAGCWRITARQQSGAMQDMPRQARKTLKVLTGKRFQWMAINAETGEFFGTGGGHYSFKEGKYTEHIEFFSRDSTRVGASLSFEGKVENDQWYHSGKSSKGEPISEIWSREKQQ